MSGYDLYTKCEDCGSWAGECSCYDEVGICMNCGDSMDLNPQQPWCERCIDE